jgi:hypothetical protein
MLPAYSAYPVSYIEPVVYGPLPDDWTGFPTAFVERLKGILLGSPFLLFHFPFCAHWFAHTF